MSPEYAESGSEKVPCVVRPLQALNVFDCVEMFASSREFSGVPHRVNGHDPIHFYPVAMSCRCH